MDRCSLCPNVNKVVPGFGPERADYLFIGEAPGKDETKLGIPFVGKTGKEFTDHYLPLAGIHPLQIYKDNCVSCLPPGDGKLDTKDPKIQALIKCCAEHHLYEAIQRVKPKLIIPMGGVAATLIPGLDLDMHYAMPFVWDIPGVGEYPIFPMWHPALGLHSPKEMLKLRNSFIRLKKYIRGELVVPVNKYPNPDYTVLSTVDEMDTYLGGNDSVEITSQVMAIDTETTRERVPFCLTLSVRPGTGRLVRAENKPVLERLNWWVSQWKAWIILHNRMFDRPILARMGVQIPSRLIQDTMMEAYHLGNLPQGLKTLAYRYLGAEMRDFNDLVLGPSTSRTLEFLAYAAMQDWPKPEEQLIRDPEGNWKLYKPQSFGTKLKRFFTDLEKNPSLNVFERWDNWESDHELVESSMGRWPGKCITHAPFDEVVQYACDDSARTLELWPIMEKAERSVRKRKQEDWYD